MSQHVFSTIAFLTALTFLAMALTACASSGQSVAGFTSLEPSAIEAPSGVPEFHGAAIGRDALRGELPSEN